MSELILIISLLGYKLFQERTGCLRTLVLKIKELEALRWKGKIKKENEVLRIHRYIRVVTLAKLEHT